MAGQAGDFAVWSLLLMILPAAMLLLAILVQVVEYRFVKSTG